MHTPAAKIEVMAYHQNGLWEPGGDYTRRDALGSPSPGPPAGGGA